MPTSHLDFQVISHVIHILGSSWTRPRHNLQKPGVHNMAVRSWSIFKQPYIERAFKDTETWCQTSKSFLLLHLNLQPYEMYTHVCATRTVASKLKLCILFFFFENQEKKRVRGEYCTREKQKMISYTSKPLTVTLYAIFIITIFYIITNIISKCRALRS